MSSVRWLSILFVCGALVGCDVQNDPVTGASSDVVALEVITNDTVKHHHTSPPGWEIQYNSLTEKYRWADQDGNCQWVGNSGMVYPFMTSTSWQGAVDDAWREFERRDNPEDWRRINSKGER